MNSCAVVFVRGSTVHTQDRKEKEPEGESENGEIETVREREKEREWERSVVAHGIYRSTAWGVIAISCSCSLTSRFQSDKSSFGIHKLRQ